MPSHSLGELREALNIINTKGNEVVLSELEDSVLKTLGKLTGEVQIEIVSAISLTENEKELFRNLLSKWLGKSALIEYKVQKDLLGGFKISVGDWKLDASLSTRLKSMRRMLGGKD